MEVALSKSLRHKILKIQHIIGTSSHSTLYSVPAFEPGII